VHCYAPGQAVERHAAGLEPGLVYGHRARDHDPEPHGRPRRRAFRRRGQEHAIGCDSLERHVLNRACVSGVLDLNDDLSAVDAGDMQIGRWQLNEQRVRRRRYLDAQRCGRTGAGASCRR
jgi:hypothetical protein